MKENVSGCFFLNTVYYHKQASKSQQALSLLNTRIRCMNETKSTTRRPLRHTLYDSPA